VRVDGAHGQMFQDVLSVGSGPAVAAVVLFHARQSKEGDRACPQNRSTRPASETCGHGNARPTGDAKREADRDRAVVRSEPGSLLRLYGLPCIQRAGGLDNSGRLS
jgi:hypothetical protein